MKTKIIALLISSILLTGCASKAAENVVEEKVGYVKVTDIQVNDFDSTITVSGKINPKEDVSVTSKVAGTMKVINVELGQKVVKGQLIAKIDDTIYKSQYSSAKAGFESAQQGLDRMTKFSDETMKSQDVQMAEAVQKSAQTNFDNVEKNYQSMKKLYEQGAIAKSDFDSLETGYNLAKQGLNTASDALKQAIRGNGYNQKSAQIGVEVAKNGYDMATENLNYTNIVAPISGFISMKNTAVGENVNPGTPILQIINVDEMYADAGISEVDIAKITAGQKVRVKIDALNGEVVLGTVANVSPSINEMSKTYPVKIIIPNTDKKLKAGMFAQLEIAIDEHKDSLAIPKEIVFKEGEISYVFIVDKNIAKKQKIETGYSSDDYIEVLSGLTGSEKVVSVGYDALIDGQKVVVKE
ncbi:MAG TPA: hypothetical protein DEP72_04105 [Clostridiales bacterium]|nr:MAG: hypothetical protein A2Y18_04385 [Clostridiales bacterium GWD2_32_19]HCC07326.1 hypothetical protein [Clostridiales bacterium]